MSFFASCSLRDKQHTCPWVFIIIQQDRTQQRTGDTPGCRCQYICDLTVGRLLNDRKQRVSCSNSECDWKPVAKGTTQGSVSGPYLFNIFFNDLNITLGNHHALFKCADDSTIIVPVWKKVVFSDQLVSQSSDWTNTNGMSCNPSKLCKELTIKNGGNRDLY